MKMEFDKFSGAKNIFLIGEKQNLTEDSLKKITKKICDPFDGFFADGAVFMETLGPNEFKWHFYNSDGSSAEMCGNAVRCAHRFIKNKNPQADTVTIHTLSGKIISRFQNDLFYVQMTKPSPQRVQDLSFGIFDPPFELIEFKSVASTEAYFVDTGVPHLVIEIHRWEEALKLKEMWLFLRKHRHFSKGTNVTLVQIQSPNSVKAISFERGVDDFTQACGTGAVAAALYVESKTNQKQITVTMPGGSLSVDTSKESPILSGQAITVGHVIIELEG